jgi:hypothetical protein
VQRDAVGVYVWACVTVGVMGVVVFAVAWRWYVLSRGW